MNNTMSQSKLSSFLEAVANTLIGYVINIAVQFIVYPFYGASFTISQNIQIGLIFMVVSLTRSFVIRRYFNDRLHKMIYKLT